MPVRSEDLNTEVRFTNAATDQLVLSYRVATDIGNRLQIQADGRMKWGSGATSTMTETLRVNDVSVLASGHSAAYLMTQVGGTNTLHLVSIGAADSGGTGYRYLRVPNGP